MASDSLLQMDSTCVVFWEGKSLALLNLQRYEEAIETSKRCLMLDTTAVEANYYVGAAYCSLAANIIMPTNINSKAYKQAAALRKNTIPWLFLMWKIIVVLFLMLRNVGGRFFTAFTFR